MILNNLLLAFNPTVLCQYWSGYLMMQPAVRVNEDKTALLGITPFWAKHLVNPPFLRETWIGQFFLAVGLKYNIIPKSVLADPAVIAVEPPQNRRHQQLQKTQWPEIVVEKVLAFASTGFFHEAAACLKPRLFFSLGNEEKRRFTDSDPHLNHNVCSFIDFHDACEVFFQPARDFTVERIKLYNTIFMLKTGTFFLFFARLSAQAALCNWPQGQERDNIKDLFIGPV